MKILVHNAVAQSIAVLAQQCSQIAAQHRLVLRCSDGPLSQTWKICTHGWFWFEIGRLEIGRSRPGLRVKPKSDRYNGNFDTICACIRFAKALEAQIPDQAVSLLPIDHPGLKVIDRLRQEFGADSIEFLPDCVSGR